jgi:hypothetical protein
MSNEYPKVDIQSRYDTSSPGIDIDRAWMKLRAQIEERERDRRRRPSRPRVALAALAVVIVLGAVSVGALEAVSHLHRHGQMIVIGDGTTVSSRTSGASTTKAIAPEAVTFDTFTQRFEGLVTQRALAGTLPFTTIPNDELTWLSAAARPLTIPDLKGYRLANGDIVVLFFTTPSFFTATDTVRSVTFPAADKSIMAALQQKYPGSNLVEDPDFGYVVVSQQYGDELRSLADMARLGTTSQWPKNAQGLTYGSGSDSMTPQDEPDLILVGATNGKVGYVLRTDLEGQASKSPQEALSQQAAQAGKDRVIPVYESDGTTKIGVFIIQG